jgi:hypothetical protein
MRSRAIRKSTAGALAANFARTRDFFESTDLR